MRVLPAGTEARVVSEQIAAGFPGAATAPVEALVQGASRGQLRALTASIRSVPGVAGATVTASRGDSALVMVDYHGPSNGGQAYTAVRDIRALPVPAGVTMLVAGTSAADVDQLAGLGARLPVMAVLIAAVTVLLLFVSFGSVVLPVLSVALNMASIVAAFGVVVRVFADGHLSGLPGFTAAGSLHCTTRSAAPGSASTATGRSPNSSEPRSGSRRCAVPARHQPAVPGRASAG